MGDSPTHAPPTRHCTRARESYTRPGDTMWTLTMTPGGTQSGNNNNKANNKRLNEMYSV